jgi:hypothetical protein
VTPSWSAQSLHRFLKNHVHQRLTQILHLVFQVDIGHGIRAPGHYIQRAGGLFPAPLPQDGSGIERVCKLFTFLGIFLAKSLQDNRLVDLPLSRSFLKLLCNGGGDNSMVPTLPTTHGHASHLSLAEGLEDSCSYEEERESVRNLTTNELDTFRKVWTLFLPGGCGSVKDSSPKAKFIGHSS